MTQPSAAPPQLSPDGHWWWDGTAWVPAEQRHQPAVPAAAQPAQPAQPVWPAAAPAPARHDGLAITSLVSSLLWVMGLGSVVAVVTGHLSRSRAKQEGREPSGLALAGLVIGYLGVSLMVVGVLAAVAIPVFLNQSAKSDTADVKSALRNAAIAEESGFVSSNAYGGTDLLEQQGWTPDPGVRLQVARVTPDDYCLVATKGRTTLWLLGSEATPSSIPCT